MSKTKELREDQVIYNGCVFTKDKKTGYYLSTKNIYNNKRIRLHRYVWICENGDIPEGFDVHHKDEDKDNNDISNFELIPGRKHQKYHINKVMLTEYQKRKKRFMETAHRAACEWHGTKEGREWHKKHWVNSMGKHINEKVKKICVVCGKEYETQLAHQENSAYCSKKCKAKYRRDNKLDHIEKVCVVCGNTFMDSKYENKKTCSKDCKVKLLLYTRDGKEWWQNADSKD